MPKKTAAAKSKPRVKSASKASWTINDVYDLLKAVNEQTLKRMEEQATRIETVATRIETLLARVNRETLGRIEEQVVSRCSSIENLNLRMERTIEAIKAKTDRLP